MSYMKNISRLGGDNLGGLIELKVAPASSISKIPDPVNGTVYGDVVFVAGFSWHTWQVQFNNLGITAKSKSSQEGNYRDYQLPFIIPGNNPEITRILRQAEQDQFIILVKDTENRQKIVGSLDAPLLFNCDFDSGRSARNLKGYECEFYSEAQEVDFFYEGGVAPPAGSVQPAMVLRGDGQVLAALQPGDIFYVTSGFSFGFRVS